MAQQKGVIFYPEHVAVVKGLLDDVEIGQLFLAICDYAENGTIPDYPLKAWGVCFISCVKESTITREDTRKRAQGTRKT